MATTRIVFSPRSSHYERCGAAGCRSADGCPALRAGGAPIAESADASPDIRILAIRHCLMLVGEALDFVSDEIFAHEPLIPWRRVIALRHRLIHGYWLIDEDIINEISRNETEALVAALDRLIQKLR